jgi:hypothetical protein
MDWPRLLWWQADSWHENIFIAIIAIFSMHLIYLFLYFWRHGCAFHIHFLMTQHLLDINPYLQHLLSLIQRECT